MKKNIMAFILLTVLIMSSITNVSQAYSYEKIGISDSSIISPLADILEWRYKVDNGKLYKRLYNATEDTWIGQWILVN